MEFKQEAVRLVKEKGVPITQVARDLGVDRSVLRTWTEKDTAGELVEPSPAAARPKPDLEEEVRRLRRENAVLREEREILKKAAAFFAKESQ
jgi:transposase